MRIFCGPAFISTVSNKAGEQKNKTESQNMTITGNKKSLGNNFISDRCRVCNQVVNLDDEGVQYPNGTCAHESCADSDNFNRANEQDFRD